MPSWTETMTDAKLVRPACSRSPCPPPPLETDPPRSRCPQDLDVALKRACESLIRSSSTALTSALRSFLDQCTAFLSSPSPLARGGLVEQEWASPERILKLHSTFRDGLEDRAAGVVRRMRVFLVEEKTVGVLLPPLWVRSPSFSSPSRSLRASPHDHLRAQEDVLETYSTFYNRASSAPSPSCSSSVPPRRRLVRAPTPDPLSGTDAFPLVARSHSLRVRVCDELVAECAGRGARGSGADRAQRSLRSSSVSTECNRRTMSSHRAALQRRTVEKLAGTRCNGPPPWPTRASRGGEPRPSSSAPASLSAFLSSCGTPSSRQPVKGHCSTAPSSLPCRQHPPRVRPSSSSAPPVVAQLLGSRTPPKAGDRAP